MEWKVTNALNRDVERQHLNKILAEIQAALQTVEVKQAYPPSPVQSIRPPSSGGGGGGGGSRGFTLTLTGDVTGSASVGTGSSTLETSLSPEARGISDAPNTGQAYWRRRGEWETVPTALESLDYLSGVGFLSFNYEGDFVPREIIGTPNQIEVDNQDGLDGNPTISLADLDNTETASGPVKIYTRDSKGRIEGDVDATTDDLPEGANNLYYTDERVEDVVVPLIEGMLTYEGLKDTLVAGANVTITADDVDETITITSTGSGGGGGGVNTVTGTNGVTVNNTDPSNPVVSLTTAARDVIMNAVVPSSAPTDGDILEYDGTASSWAVTKGPRELYLDGGNF